MPEPAPTPAPTPAPGAGSPSAGQARPAPDAAEPAAAPPLVRNRDFLLVLIGQGVSSVGDAFSLTALPLLVLAITGATGATGSGSQLGLVMLAYTIPCVAASPLAGTLADRWDRKRIMVGADLGRAAVLAVLPLAAAGALLRLELVYVISALLGLLTPLFTAAYTAAVPRLVHTDQVAAATGTLQAVTRLGLMIGPSIAGVLATLSGAVTALAIDAATFLFSAATLAGLRRAPPRAHRVRQPVSAELRRGLAHVAGTPPLRSFMVLNALLTLVTAPGLIALVHHLQLERRQAPWVFGFVLSANGIGAIAGYLAAGRVRRAWRTLFVGGNTLRAAANLSFPLLAASPLYMAAGLVAGFASAFVHCLATLFYVQSVPDAFRGRVAGLAGALESALYAVGLTAGGLAIDGFGSGSTIALIGALQLLIGAACWLSPRVRWPEGPARPAAPPPTPTPTLTPTPTPTTTTEPP
ncbi:MAG TPA: MFS transporter [Kofleriaceae bacterium]|nr:MFS transporter [Kofleriaceae bacterium]